MLMLGACEYQVKGGGGGGGGDGDGDGNGKAGGTLAQGRQAGGGIDK